MTLSERVARGSSRRRPRRPGGRAAERAAARQPAGRRQPTRDVHGPGPDPRRAGPAAAQPGPRRDAARDPRRASRTRSSAPSTRCSTCRRRTSAAKVEAIVDRVIGANGFAVNRDERERLVEEMVHEVTGLGPLEPLLHDETITEVMVNGPHHVYIERAGKIQRVDIVFLNDEHVLRIIDRIITPIGRRIDETSPRVDARLPDGSRVNAIIEPLSLVGPVITVRKFSDAPYTVEDLIRFGTATPEMFDFLRACVEARLNVFVSGGTGSGKTTTLNVLSSFIPETSGSSRSRTPPSSSSARSTWSRSSRARQPRGRGRDHHPEPAAQRDAHAPRPDHRRRVPRRRGARHAPGDDDRPRRLAVDRPRQQPARHAPPPRDDGPDDRLRDAAAGDPRADRVRRRPHRPHRPPQGRLAQDHEHHRGLRDRGRRDPDPGHLRVRADRHRATARSRARSCRPGIRPTFMAQFARNGDRAARRASSASRPKDAKPIRPAALKARWGGSAAARREGRLRRLGRARPRRQGRRHGLRLVDRPGRSGDGRDREAARSRSTPASASRTSRRGSRRPAARSTRSCGPTGRCATPPTSTRSTRSGCAGSRATRRSARER